MKQSTYNMDKDMFLEKSILLSKVKELSKYYNNEVIEILTSLVMLEESVFRHIDLGEFLGKLDLFFEIAKYNICNRTIQTIDKMDSIDSSKMNANYWYRTMNIYHTLNDKESFEVLKSDFKLKDRFTGEDKKPYINLYEATIPIEKYIEIYQSKINDLKNTKYGRDEQFCGYTEDNQPCFTPVYGGPNSQQYFQDILKIENLEKKIKELQSYGKTQFEVCNKITDTLIKDWGIEFRQSDRPNQDAVRRLSWIDINKLKIE